MGGVSDVAHRSRIDADDTMSEHSSRDATIALDTSRNEDDAHLVRAIANGDHTAVTLVYERYGDQLYDAAIGVVRNPHDAADVVQDVFVSLSTRIAQLREPSRLRPWLMAVMRNAALDRVRARSRVAPQDPTDLLFVDDDATDPHEDVSDPTDFAQLVREAAGGLEPRDQLVLDLSERRGLTGRELAMALGVTENHSYTLVHRMRQRFQRSLAAYCAARLGRRECRQLDQLLRGWNGNLTPIVRKRVARHIDRCVTCQETCARAVPENVPLGAPFAMSDEDVEWILPSAAAELS